MGPMTALVATTRVNSEILRREDDLATIAAGKLADLILVDGDPLTDITVFQDYRRKITLILQDGIVFKNILPVPFNGCLLMGAKKPDPVDPFGKASGRYLLTMVLSIWSICRTSPQVDLACISFMSTKPAI